MYCFRGFFLSIRRNWLWAPVFTTCLALFSISSAFADQDRIIVKNDFGGSVKRRAELIQQYKDDLVEVQIRGRFCLSSCTMYLGLNSVCIAPKTIFGFHGPSSATYGIGLPPSEFEFWSREMARHYPEPIRSWYVNVGRNRTIGYYSFSGRELIEMGVKKCALT